MVAGVSHITFAVSDLDRSVAFYRDLLGMQLVTQWERGAYLLAGEVWIALNVGETDPSSDYSHIAFTVRPDDLPDMATAIVNAGGAVWQPARDHRSFYFTDPDGHKLELHSGTLQERLAELQPEATPSS